MLNRNNDQKTDVIEYMRNGDGHVIRRTLIAPEDSCGKFKMCAKITLEPGCSIGEHGHQPDAEFCYMLEGELTILDNGKEHTVYPGDAWMCGDGAVHYSKNTSDKPAVFLAMVVE